MSTALLPTVTHFERCRKVYIHTSAVTVDLDYHDSVKRAEKINNHMENRYIQPPLQQLQGRNQKTGGRGNRHTHTLMPARVLVTASNPFSLPPGPQGKGESRHL